MTEKIGDGADDRCRIQHAGFCRYGVQFLKDRFELLAHDPRAARLNALHAPRILRRDASDDARAMHSERRKRFEVGLDARPAAAVGTGDRQGRRDGSASLHFVAQIFNLLYRRFPIGRRGQI